MEIKFRNVNDSFRTLVSYFRSYLNQTHDGNVHRYPSRAGGILRITEPVMITYSHTRERVLFNSLRDVNPFSLVYESLWTLSGRDDVKSIAYYTKGMVRYSDDGETWYGAYGHRWRHAPYGVGRKGNTSYGGTIPDYRDEFDQLDRAVDLLRDNTTRRVVLSMWCPERDLKCQRRDGKDYPCNTHCYLTVRDNKMNLTVCNRSNDLVLGMLGTNYVVFSFLLEYLAARLGVECGTYTQFTNDLHLYEGTHGDKLAGWLEDTTPDHYTDAKSGTLRTVPLVKDPAAFERELPKFVERHACPREWVGGGLQHYTEPFLVHVAEPMLAAFHYHKAKRYDQAADVMATVAADDWRLAAEGWLRRRQSKETL